MELDLGCREDVQVRECFSLPEILELKAHCELACYRGAALNCLQCPFGLTGPVFEVILRHLCRRRDKLSVLKVQILCAECHGCRKNIIIVFTLDLFMRLFSDKENFSCAIPHFAIWSRDLS